VSSFSRVSKRAFDIVMSLVGLAFTVPFYPLIFLAIMLEDGRPFFFGHRRETCGGREFPCLKFRSMRKDAEAIKKGLKSTNLSDGPHFFMERDPRLTRVGWFLRATNIDELPQLFNVLLGQMSIVGPRPSPYSENQFCPAWREARLSMRPGITGLWQVRRTRQSGLDFQEWIKYDIEYIENAGWRMDLLILWQTIGAVLKLEKRR
jgi:lipopolysaccharide/colanic/teichoic acid biosynthesis glycosyltransferase